MTTASRVSDSRVTDEMSVAYCARELIRIVKAQAGGYTTGPGYQAFTAACMLEAALACQGTVVSVADLEALQRYDTFAQCCNNCSGYVEIDANKDGDWIKREELTALIAKANGHE